ncbi:MAG: hypothetical protein GWM90_17730, partial [Gemmatimonadetes bacterium]|nr:hypothetical protein [Gemmatimonadota bacterium]NIQ56190.1 hypothetical protein [Gemmatimonadota bacterium]NIU76384.1 hypothetical protein [Gammaproteobacteria bacterium]NIX45865.1 hypothetical protein [Gemmatimonadota bacterium]NIY10171.1 hypothetical protein [Gemmatimonadota bacterium]
SGGDSQVFTGRLSYDFFLVEPAVCAVAGVRYATDEAPGVDERFGVPVGIGIGKRLRGERVDVIVY